MNENENRELNNGDISETFDDTAVLEAIDKLSGKLDEQAKKAEETTQEKEKAEEEKREKDKEELLTLFKSYSKGDYNIWYGIEVFVDGADGQSFDLVDQNGDVVVADYITFSDGYGANFGMDLPQGRFNLKNENYIICSTTTGDSLVVLVEDPDGDTVAEWGYYASCFLKEITQAEEPEEGDELITLVGKVHDELVLNNKMQVGSFFFIGMIIGILLFKTIFERLR